MQGPKHGVRAHARNVELGPVERRGGKGSARPERLEKGGGRGTLCLNPKKMERGEKKRRRNAGRQETESIEAKREGFAITLDTRFGKRERHEQSGLGVKSSVARTSRKPRTKAAATFRQASKRNNQHFVLLPAGKRSRPKAAGEEKQSLREKGGDPQ